MEWLECVNKAIKYIEDNLLNVSGPSEIANRLNISKPYLQRGFCVLTGYSVGEYIRNRRLFEAAIDIRDTDIKMVDIASRYGYETQESFTKAFARFHGAKPSSVRKGEGRIKQFVPITIAVKILGGEASNIRIERKGDMTFVGIEKEISLTFMEKTENKRGEIWNDFCNGAEFSDAAKEFRKAIWENCIGEYVVIGQNEEKPFYMIAGRYAGGRLPEEMKIIKKESCDWAILERNETLDINKASAEIEEARKSIERYTNYEACDNLCVICHERQQHGILWGGNSSLWIPVRAKRRNEKTCKTSINRR